jgi:DNA primase
MTRLDQIQHNLDPQKKVQLNEAVAATEEIRRWVRTLQFLDSQLG